MTFLNGGKKKSAVVSGGFDPLHRGHIDLFNVVRQVTDYLIVIVESDAWVSKKHKVMMPLADRMAIVQSVVGVDLVVPNNNPSGDDSDLLSTLMPTMFAVGPDHFDKETLPEYKMCAGLGIQVVCFNELTKRSSSDYIAGVQWDNPPVTTSVILEGGDGSVLVCRKDRGKIGMVGGFVEKGESIEEAGRREVLEEIGVDVGDLTYYESRAGTYPDGRRLLSTVVRGSLDKGATLTLSSEIESVSWVSDVPREPFFADCDLRTLTRYFGSRR